MKYVQYIFIYCFLLWSGTGLTQSNQLFLQSVDPITLAELDLSAEIIETRLENSQTTILSSNVREDGIELHLVSDSAISKDDMMLLVTTKGDLGFRETIDRAEFFKAISSNDPILRYIKRDLVPALPEIEEYNAMIAEINEVDLAITKQHLDRLQKQNILKDVELAFGVKNREGITRLYSLAKQQTIVLSRNDIAKIELVPSTDDKSTDISLVFSEPGAQKWANMTKQNMGRMIAVVLDDVVLMAPKVLEEISGGRAQISGLWSDGGDKVLYSILSSEILPTAFEVQIK